MINNSPITFCFVADFYVAVDIFLQQMENGGI